MCIDELAIYIRKWLGGLSDRTEVDGSENTSKGRSAALVKG